MKKKTLNILQPDLYDGQMSRKFWIHQCYNFEENGNFTNRFETSPCI